MDGNSDSPNASAGPADQSRLAGDHEGRRHTGALSSSGRAVHRNTGTDRGRNRDGTRDRNRDRVAYRSNECAGPANLDDPLCPPTSGALLHGGSHPHRRHRTRGTALHVVRTRGTYPIRFRGSLAGTVDLPGSDGTPHRDSSTETHRRGHRRGSIGTGCVAKQGVLHGHPPPAATRPCVGGFDGRPLHDQRLWRRLAAQVRHLHTCNIFSLCGSNRPATGRGPVAGLDGSRAGDPSRRAEDPIPRRLPTRPDEPAETACGPHRVEKAGRTLVPSGLRGRGARHPGHRPPLLALQRYRCRSGTRCLLG